MTTLTTNRTPGAGYREEEATPYNLKTGLSDILQIQEAVINITAIIEIACSSFSG